MSKTIEVSDSVYEELKDAAAAEKMTPAAWIAASLRARRPHQQAAAVLRCRSDGKPAKTMADLLAGRVGVISSAGDGRLSENHSKEFGEYLEEKRRAGRL